MLTHELYETGQCFIAHSLSKAWLERGVFGVVVSPELDYEKVKSVIGEPALEASTSAYAAMLNQPDLADIQQLQFKAEWERLTPDIRKFVPDFTPPENGYFKVIPVNAEQVLKDHGALIVPGSVFGSKNPNVSVVTCLFDMK